MPSYKNHSDAELLDLLKRSDHGAYTEIYNRFSGLLYHSVRKRISNASNAEDIIQELFTNIWQKRETLEVPGLLSAYLYVAVRNTMLNFIERDKANTRRIQSIQDFIDQEPVMTDHLVREKQLIQLIELEIKALPAKMRRVFELTRNHHLSHAEIASALQISKETVHSHSKRALKILRTKLSSIHVFFSLF